MRKTARLRMSVIVAMAAVLAAGCGARTNGDVDGPMPPAGPGAGAPGLEHLSGTWIGTWTNVAPDESSGELRLDWTQDGADLSGTISMPGHPCLADGVIRGLLTGPDVAFEATGPGGRMAFTGSVAGGEMAGTYQGDCAEGTEGTWETAKSGTRAAD